MLADNEWLTTISLPLLVVGNGVLANPVPEAEYKSVVRINNYILGGRSGKKVTHWVANGYQNIEARPINPVLIPWTERMELKRGNMSGMFFARMCGRVIYTTTDDHIYEWFSSSTRDGNRFPSTGFCFLAWLKRYKVLFDLIGFDGMRTGHFDNPAWEHGHKQTQMRERTILRDWKVKQR